MLDRLLKYIFFRAKLCICGSFYKGLALVVLNFLSCLLLDLVELVAEVLVSGLPFRVPQATLTFQLLFELFLLILELLLEVCNL